MALKLYVKIQGEFKEVDSVLAGDRVTALKRVKVSFVIKKYIDDCTSQKCANNQKSEKIYFQKLQDFLDSHDVEFIADVKATHLEQFEAKLLKSMKAASVNRRFNSFRHFFRKCVDWEYIFKSPCLSLKKRREEDNPRKPWDWDLFRKFHKSCSGVYSDLFMFLWLTGCRPMEAKNFRWTDIDYKEKTITLRCGKNAKIVRYFPLTKKLDQLLHSMKPIGLHVFTDNGKEIKNDLLSHYCKKRLEKLGVSGYSVYGIRHGFGTKLANKKVSAYHIAHLMGHSDLETTKRYVHAEKKYLHQVLDNVT